MAHTGNIGYPNMTNPAKCTDYMSNNHNVRYLDDNGDSKPDRRIDMSPNEYAKENYFYDKYGTLTNSHADAYQVEDGEIGSLFSTTDREYYPCGIIKSEITKTLMGLNTITTTSTYNEIADLLSETYEYNENGKIHKAKKDYEYYPDGALKQETFSGHDINNLDCRGIREELTQYGEGGKPIYNKFFIDKNEDGNFEHAQETYYNEDGSKACIIEYADSDTDGALDTCLVQDMEDNAITKGTLYIYDDKGNLTNVIDQTPRNETETQDNGIFAFFKEIF